MPVINSWKYAGAWARPKGTLMYLYLPNSELSAAFGIKIYLEVYGGNQLINPRLKILCTI